MEDYNKYNMSMNQTIDYKIRPLCQDESSLLKDFLYEAIFIPKGIEAPSREVINAPELKIYFESQLKIHINCIVGFLYRKRYTIISLIFKQC